MPDSHYPGPPKWVRGLWIIGFLAVVAFVAIHLAGLAPMGRHGL
jgi:hypothetical protein